MINHQNFGYFVSESPNVADLTPTFFLSQIYVLHQTRPRSQESVIALSRTGPKPTEPNKDVEHMSAHAAADLGIHVSQYVGRHLN